MSKANVPNVDVTEASRRWLTQEVEEIEKEQEYGGIGVKLTSTIGGIGPIGPSRGVEVLDIVVGMPASRSDLQIGDVIVSVNGKMVLEGASSDDVSALIIGPKDQSVSIKVRRNGSLHDIVLNRSELSASQRYSLMSDKPLREGQTKLTLTVTRTAGELFGLAMMSAPTGIVIVDVQSGCADKVLKAGDILQSINKQRVTSVVGGAAMLKQAMGTVEFEILRSKSLPAGWRRRKHKGRTVYIGTFQGPDGKLVQKQTHTHPEAFEQLTLAF